ncbi:protelomerase family protein [Leptolyngbya sp. ST-U4]|uniref:protelomerase family protein n=1 Tax=Leptolyngbya sp. ST-U4 TaxID=2933912 RepID=UPI00329853E9
MNRAEIISEYRDRVERGDKRKLSTEERAVLVQDFIDQLQTLRSAKAIEKLCRDEIELLEAGYGAGTNSTTNYLSAYRKAIAQAAEQGKLPMTDETSYLFNGHKQRTGEPIQSLNHLAYDLMRYDNAIYVANRKQTHVGNNQRQDTPQPFNPDRYLEKAIELLQSEEPETLAVGIAAVTGRRHTEVVVSGKFSTTKHSYVLMFDGQLKKADPVEYAILTLLPAAQVKEAIDRFRAMLPVEALAGLKSEDQEVAAFRARVNTRVRRSFQDTQILPLLPGFQSVSIHRLRAAYARVAIHYWLPGQGVNEQRWLQFYLGHVAAADMRDAANSSSTAHYFGYRLVDDQGKPITVTGIKLMANPLPSPTPQQLDTQQQANDRFAQSPEADRLDSSTPVLDPTPDEEEAMSPTQHEVETIATDLQTLIDQEPKRRSTTAPLPEFAPAATEQPSKPKRNRPRYRDLRVNVVDLTAAADRLGIDAPVRAGYQSLLEQVLQAAAQPTPAPAAPNPSELLAPLLEELAAIKQQMNAGQAGAEVEQLRQQTEQQQQEIDRLCAELKQANDRLQTIAATAQEWAGIQSTPTPAPPAAPAQQQQSVSQPPAQPPVQPPAPTQRPAPGRPPAGKLSPSDRVPIAITALMDYNQHCRPIDRWYLSGNIIATAAGANPALVVTPWLQSHPAAVSQIDQHNTSIGLNQRSNGKEKDRKQLKTIYDRFVEGKAIQELEAIVHQFDPQSE